MMMMMNTGALEVHKISGIFTSPVFRWVGATDISLHYLKIIGDAWDRTWEMFDTKMLCQSLGHQGGIVITNFK
jgi:hypothetical protein